jgi:hypothetical protein
MINFEITKMQKIYEVNNDMAHNFYYAYYGKIYNEDKTKYRKFKYVLWFDVFDIMEFFEKDFYTKNDIKQYAENLEFSPLFYIKNYDDEKGLKEFYKEANATIDHYNKINHF